MGCIRSKPSYNQDEKEDEYVFEGPDESHSAEFKLSFAVEREFFESSSDVGNLPKKFVIGNDSVATKELARINPTGLDYTSDNTEDKSTDDDDDDDDDDVMTKRMQLLRDIAKLQMAELRMARNRLHWCIIQRNAMIVVESLKMLKKNQPLYDEYVEIPTGGGGEMSLTDDVTIEQNETKPKDESPVKEIAFGLPDVVLNDINYDGLNAAGKDEEPDSDYEDTDLSDFGHFQLRRHDRTRMTIRRPSRLPPSTVSALNRLKALSSRRKRAQSTTNYHLHLR